LDEIDNLIPRYCTLSGSNGVTIQCPVNDTNWTNINQLQGDNTISCNRLLKKLTFIIKYSNPNGLTNVYYDAEFIDNNSQSFDQIFQVVFVNDAVPLDNFYFRNKLSGNPGYQLGEPIQASYSQQQNNNTVRPDR
jgi:hypothetical protein